MPPKSWKALTRVATSPFRKRVDSNASSKLDSEGQPSSSVEIPRASSPDQSTFAVATPPEVQTAQAPYANPLPITMADQDAVDLSSPVDAVPRGALYYDDNYSRREGEEKKVDDSHVKDVASGDDSVKATPQPASDVIVIEPAPLHEVVSHSGDQERAKEAGTRGREEGMPATTAYPNPYAVGGDEAARPSDLPGGIRMAVADEVSSPEMSTSMAPNSDAVRSDGTGATDLDIGGNYDHKSGPKLNDIKVSDGAADEQDVGAGYLVVRPTNPNGDTTRDLPTQRRLQQYSPFEDVFSDSNAAYGSGLAAPPLGSAPPTATSASHSPLGQTEFSRPYNIPPIRPLTEVTPEQAQGEDEDNAGLLGEEENFRYPDSLPEVMLHDASASYTMDLTEWTTYHLPNGVKYFCHSKARIVTDVDITHTSALRKVRRHIEEATKSYYGAKQRQIKGIGNYLDDRLIDDSTPPVTSASAHWPSKETERLYTTGFGYGGYGATSTTTAYDHGLQGDGKMAGLELWIRGLGASEVGRYEATVSPIAVWVDHLSRKVTSEAPWGAVPTGDSLKADDVTNSRDVERLQLLYWDYVETHPAHTHLPHGALEEAAEVLTWCYTEQLIQAETGQEPHRQTPFTLSESRELLDLLKSFNTGGTSPLQTKLVAKVHIRLAKYRQTHVDAHRHGHHSEPEPVVYRDPFGNFLVRAFIGLFCFGLPYLYVPKPVTTSPVGPRRQVHFDGYTEIDELRSSSTVQHSTGLLADSPIFAASVVLVASIMITAAIAFLALPGLEDASRLSSLICLFFSASSLGAGIINLRRRVFDAHNHGLVPQNRPFLQSLPLVFLLWAIISLITSTFLYIFRVSTTHDHDSSEELLQDVLRWVAVAVGSSLGLVLLISAFASRRKA